MVLIQLIGGPTALLEVDGLRLVTDPTFDQPGDYPRPNAPTLVKLTGPAVAADEMARADVVLLSHDQHADNLDQSGLAYLGRVPLTLTTPSGAGRLAGDGVTVRGMAPWEHVDLPRPGRGLVRVTAVPARHGPEGCEPFTGEVTGFVLSGAGVPTVYVSGDNSSLDVVRDVAERCGPVDVALLFAGAGVVPPLEAVLTLTGGEAAEASVILGSPHVVVIHADGWTHFTEGRTEIEAAFERAGLQNRLNVLAPGAVVTL